MTNYEYLIIGGGMTAAATVDGIRQVDSTGGIGLISAELDAPYDRPPLSKALWKGKPLDSIWRTTENKGVTVHLGRVVKEIVPKQKRVVDEFLRTSHPDIHAAGDVAAFYNPALGKRIRVEHEDNANSMGQLAGRNMAGKSEPYHHLPFFYSNLFDLGYEAVGEVDSRLETFADWTRPNEEGVIYYLQNDRVRGVLLWNVWEQVEAARQFIAEPGPFTATNLKGRLPTKTSNSKQDS